MSEKISLLGVGSPIVDLLAHVPDTFIDSIDGDKGGMVMIDSSAMEEMLKKLPAKPITAAGGSAGNTAFAFATLGGKAAMLGKLGNDETGDFYQAEFKKLGGDVSRFKIGEVPNGRCLCLITTDGERTLRPDLGAAMTLSPAEISVEDFQNCEIAHIEGYLLFNRDLMFSVLNAAKKAACKISLDLASFEVVNASKDILKDLLTEYVDIVFANEDETTAFMGKDVDFEQAARDLASMCGIAAVKLGAKGSIICQGNQLMKVEANPVSKVLDTTGAGDYWAAGFLYALSQGKDLKRCGETGSVLGAEVVQVIGAKLNPETWKSISERI